jgi:hypothetical protein
MIGWLMNNELENIEDELNLRQYPIIWLEGQSRTTEHLSQDDWPSSHDRVIV